jgi:hypothetical protein
MTRARGSQALGPPSVCQLAVNSPANVALVTGVVTPLPEVGMNCALPIVSVSCTEIVPFLSVIEQVPDTQATLQEGV